jgi:hypothetical protein
MRKRNSEATMLKTITVRLPENLIARAKIEAVKNRRTLQETVELALTAWLAASREGGSR